MNYKVLNTDLVAAGRVPAHVQQAAEAAFAKASPLFVSRSRR